MKNVIIYGAGSVGRLSEQIIDDINNISPEYNLIGFLDDDEKKWLTKINDVIILGGIDWLKHNPDISVALGFSNPVSKLSLISKIKSIGHRKFATLIHPQSWISKRVSIGTGSIIYPGVHLDVDIKIGDFCLFNKLCTIGHDTIIGDYTTISPGVNLGGNNIISEGVELGINAATLQNICIGSWSIIGGGSMVIKDVPDNVVAAGVPAKLIKTNERLKKI